MKTFKRNAVIITVILFVGVAAYLNWAYNSAAPDAIGPAVDVTAPADPASAPETGLVGDSGSGLFYDPENKNPASSQSGSDQFAMARLNRQQARDAAVETLSIVSQTDGASQETVDDALGKMTAIAQNTQKEAELESLIMSKGFADCVVFISEEGVKVTVPAPLEGLSQTSVAKITDIITSETAFKALDLRIIEVK